MSPDTRIVHGQLIPPKRPGDIWQIKVICPYCRKPHYHGAGLNGKLANVVDDLSSRHLADTSTFKRIVGGDPITADRKHRDPLTFRPFARLLFSTNEYPQSADASSGFYDHWLVIPFSAEFRGQHCEVPRQVLAAQLAAPQELSGVLNRALAVPPSIHAPFAPCGRRFGIIRV